MKKEEFLSLMCFLFVFCPSYTVYYLNFRIFFGTLTLATGPKWLKAFYYFRFVAYRMLFVVMTNLILQLYRKITVKFY